MNPEIRLSRREREILDIVFEGNSMTAAEVREAMASPPTDAAVRATLRSLVEKGVLEHQYDGPRYVYSPTVSRKNAQQSALSRVLRVFFGGSVEQVMETLLTMEEADLAPEKRARIQALLEEAEQREAKP